MLYEFGLTQVATEDLKTMLRYLHRQEMTCPLTPAELARFGLQRCAGSILGHVRGLEAEAVRAVVVGVLAERLDAEERALTLAPPTD
jgi:hypothetical protein